MGAVGMAGGREGQNATGSQIAVEITGRALKGQLGAVAAADGDARAVASAETAHGGGALPH